ncbi:MAG: hypothetical protein JNM17_04510 [Archangium sp.]|nr:hypothetical protein [Archangium sp.]
MRSSRGLVLSVVLVLFGCEEVTTLEPLNPDSFDAVQLTTMLELSAAPAFADERGGGVFVDLAGRVVRVRPNGDRGVIEAHPSNQILPGPAFGVWALGPSNSLVATSRGLFVADQGWLITPPWQLPAEGVKATALDGDGVAWIVHDTGLFRLERGALKEFKLADASLTGITAIASAPTLDASPGIWFARDGKLFAASKTSVTEYRVRDSGLSNDTLAGGVLGLVGIAPAKDSGGELWAITNRSLLLYTGTSWREYTLPFSPRRIMGAGRYAWLEAGDAVYRYDGDRRSWSEAKGLASSPTLVAVDAAGNAWVRVDTQMISIAASNLPRVRGLYQGARVFDGQLVLETSLPVSVTPSSVNWTLDGVTVHELDLTKGTVGAGPTADLRFFSLGGAEVSGVLKPVSFATLEDGWHTLTVTATVDDQPLVRKLHFEFRGAENSVVSWDRDIRELGVARCSKCHATGTTPELITYDQWRTNAALIAAAVRESRMPADGPLDSAGIAAIVRWVNGGAQP